RRHDLRAFVVAHDHTGRGEQVRGPDRGPQPDPPRPRARREDALRRDDRARLPHPRPRRAAHGGDHRGDRGGHGRQLRPRPLALPGSRARGRIHQGELAPQRGDRGRRRPAGGVREHLRGAGPVQARRRRDDDRAVLRMSGLLDGKVAVVTGSGRGLGKAYARALAAAGAAVVVNDVDAAAADETVAEIAAAGGRAVAVVAPVGPSATAEQLVTTAVAAFGKLDVLVANAGVLRDRVLWKTADDDFDLVVETHLRGAFTTGRAAAVHMRERGEGGRIVLIGSPAGQHGNFGQTSYAAA